ncbi:MAG: winged helix DNA-binding protein [Mogibacterium sp.]|nr:winged helix DNA-binding protein [Mogibacterium sp.]
MKKTIDEQLFELVMKAPRSVRRKTFEFPFPRPFFVRERLLVIADSYDGAVRQKTLVEELDVSPAAVSELVSKLERDEYVKREVDPDDKRATLIKLTDLGKARAAELADERNERFSKAFTALTDKEKDQLLKLLEKLTAEEEDKEE